MCCSSPYYQMMSVVYRRLIRMPFPMLHRSRQNHSGFFHRVRATGCIWTRFLTGDWKVPGIPLCGTGKPALRSADIPVRGFGRLSSRPMIPARTSRPRTVSRCTRTIRAKRFLRDFHRAGVLPIQPFDDAIKRHQKIRKNNENTNSSHHSWRGCPDRNNL
jgi:hypothetical protein